MQLFIDNKKLSSLRSTFSRPFYEDGSGIFIRSLKCSDLVLNGQLMVMGLKYVYILKICKKTQKSFRCKKIKNKI